MIIKISAIVLTSAGVLSVLYFTLISFSTPLIAAGISVIILCSTFMILLSTSHKTPGKKYFILLSAAFCVVDLILWLTGQNDLSLYLTAEVLTFVLITLLFNFDFRTASGLRSISVILFIGFLASIIIKLERML
jgi:hypothetical protein